MTPCRIKYYLKALGRNVLSIKGISAVLSVPGACVTALKMADAFFEGTKLPPTLHHYFNSYWWFVLLVGVIFAIYACWPKLVISGRLNGRDVIVELTIGDIFSLPGAIVVGSNTTFDTLISNELISKHSVQGQFTERYYSGAASLDVDLDAELRTLPAQTLPAPRTGKNKRYQIGTAVKLKPRERTGYFLAIGDINEHGNALGSFEGLKQSLASLWVYIGDRGSKMEPILIPILGTGFGRLTQPRSQIIQETIKSFVAACSEKTFCEKLTIVLHDKDVLDHKIDFDALGDFLRHVCTYADFAAPNATNIGTPVTEQ